MMIRVFWSDRLESMADRLLGEWGSRAGGGPFERTCVVVGDMATRNWLKDRFLLHRAPGARRVLANVDFAPLPEFANDWLAAVVRGPAGGAPRDPADHPFSQGVMAWRIDAILRETAGDPEFRTLSDYIAAGGDGAADRRRFDLAVRLAQMFDDYLVSRHATLHAWERGIVPSGGDERWQALLYRELARGVRSYAADYEEALAPGLDPARAFENGFPRYAAVHVFDVMDAPWPYLAMLKRISETIPVTFWTFNPSRGFWIENPTRRQAIREKAARLRAALADGTPPADEPDPPDFSSPDARLLGALATGTRGMLANQLDLTDGNCEWLGDADAGDFSALRTAGTEVHVCHSPRRELEAARDALHRFFRENADAKPSDALVLCADWQAYSPLVEAVFGGKDGEGADGRSLPVATAGIAAASPVVHSFGELLDFRTNRFEVSRVFALLGVPEIRDRFGIDAAGLPVLRDLARNDNIHWGFDDEDVRRILGQEEKPEEERNRFTWQRGIDRLTLDALLGPREDEDSLYEAGALGRLLPGGHVESERATLVGGLFRFTRRLMRLRRFLRRAQTAEEWRDGLLAAIDDFYRANDASLGEILGLRRAVESTAAAAIRARETDGRPAGRTIPGEVFCAAADAAVQNRIRPLSSAGDAVRIAPLSNGSAVQARFVWICGLNDGTFPRSGYRPTFDLIGRHPTMYDVTPRERDATALLKAALGARDRLCLSYVGRDIRTNQAFPPAVPLTDLLEWFRASGVPVATYGHPLQSYSEKYFESRGGARLPPVYSTANRDAAAALAAARGEKAPAEPALPRIVPFPLNEEGETIIELDDLASFFDRPNQFIAKRRLGLKSDGSAFARLDDDDGLDARLPFDLSIRVKIRGRDGVADATGAAEALMESGIPLTEGEISRLADEQESATASFRDRPLFYTKANAPGFQVPDRSAAQALAEWEDRADSVPFHVDLELEGPGGRRRFPAVVNGVRRTIRLPVEPSGSLEHAFAFSARNEENAENWKRSSWIRHLAGHAAGGRFVTAMMFGNTGAKPVRTYRPLEAGEAKGLFQAIVQQAVQPFPFDFSAVSHPERDVPPDGWLDAVGDLGPRIVSTYGKKMK